MTLTAADKLSKARLRACTLAPYFRSGLLSLIPREAPGLNTLAVTNQWVMLWDGAFVDRVSDDELAAVIIHELMHVTLNHHARCKAIGADAEQWNIAADAAINDSLRGLPLPANCVTPESIKQPSGLSAEQYYRGLQAQKQDNEQDQQKQEESSEKGQESPQAGAQGKPACGSCSGNAHAKESEHTQGEQGRSSAEQARAQKQIAQEIQEQERKHPGSVPADLKVWASETLAPPVIDWRVKLAQLVRASIAHKAGAVSHAFKRPSRRQAGLGYGAGTPTLPALIAPLPRVAIALDTSGSMSRAIMAEAMAEVQGIIKSLGAACDFVTCDAELGKLTTVTSVAQATKVIQGGGGTDFRPVFAAFDKRKPAPDILVYLTDGCGPAPTHAPKYRTIWALIGKHAATPAQWGSVVTITK